MTEKTYSGSCHCGSVRYQVALDLEKPATRCNCSMCGRSGTMLLFVPAEKFTLEQGESNLTDYQFNKMNIHHLFCKTCGIKPFARGKGPNGPVCAVNVRCLDGVDLAAVPVKDVDGKSY